MNQSNRIWKDIPGYEGYYQASNDGLIQSVTKAVKQWSGVQIKKGKILSPAIDKIGYLNCALSKENKLRSFKVHRLVALAHIPNPNGFAEINHKDCNKLNNHVSNLEWCDRKGNMEHASKNSLITKITRDRSNRSVVKTKHIPFLIAWRKAGVQVSKLALMYGCSVDVIYKVTKGKL